MGEIDEAIDVWMERTRFHSSPRAMRGDPSYDDVLVHGEDALVPALLRLRHDGSIHMMVLLHDLSGENPVPVHLAGNTDAMTDHWLRWGRNRGLI